MLLVESKSVKYHRALLHARIQLTIKEMKSSEKILKCIFISLVQKLNLKKWSLLEVGSGEGRDKERFALD